MQENQKHHPYAIFRGSWLTHEEHLVAEALHEVETRLRLPQVPEYLGRPWICVCEKIGSSRTYIATRMHVAPALVAGSALELCTYLWTLREVGAGAL